MRQRLLFRLMVGLILVLAMATNGIAASISGTLSYSGFQTGAIYSEGSIYGGYPPTSGYPTTTVNFADYFPLNASTRIYVTTRGDQQDLGKTYVNRVIGTEQISTTLTTKVGVFPTIEANAPDTYASFNNYTNNGTSVKLWGGESFTLDTPWEIGLLNDGEIVPPPFICGSNRCYQISECFYPNGLTLINFMDITVSGVMYSDALVMIHLDPDYSVKPVNFGTNTLGFQESYLPYSNNPLPGAIDYIDVLAFGVGEIASIGVGVVTGDIDGIIELQSIEASPLIGTWGYGRLRHKSDDTWATKSGKITYSSDGTGVNTYQYNDNGILGSGTESFTYSVDLNQDGSMIVIYTYPDMTTETRRYVLSDDSKMLIMDGTDLPDRQRFRVAIRMDTSKTYTNADFSGDYYGIGYDYDSEGTNWPGYYVADSLIANANGSGIMSETHTFNADGIITTFSWPPHSYSVNPDGSVNVGSNAFLSGDGKLIVGASSNKTESWETVFAMKKGDKSYCPADIAGTWVLSGFGDDNGNSFNATFGSMNCDSSGNCNFTKKNQRDGNVTYESGTALLTVDNDGSGSFGTSLGDLAPYYAGAIGNNGNSILMNVSFDSTGPQGLNHRQINVGVKCSNCCNIGDPKLSFEEDDCAIKYNSVWNTYTCPSCSGGSLKYSRQTGARAEFTFNGTGIKWLVAKGPKMGKARVYLDGVNMGLVDLYKSSISLVTLQKTGLAPGNHTVAIEVSGLKNPSATDKIINIDVFEVIP